MHSSAYTMWIELVSPQNPTPQILTKLTAVMKLQMLEPTKLIDIVNDEATLGFGLPRFGLS